MKTFTMCLCFVVACLFALAMLACLWLVPTTPFWVVMAYIIGNGMGFLTMCKLTADIGAADWK